MVHRLRYQVYVLERGFESPSDHPGGRERDDHDAQAWHFLGLDERGQPVGTVRLIHGGPLPLPLEQVCRIEQPVDDRFQPHLGEVSRLAVSKEFRRRAGDGVYGASILPDEPVGGDERRGLPVLFLGLLREAYQQSVRAGMTHVYAAMERQLYVLLKRHGIRFQAIGPEVQYHGTRIPHVLPLAEFEVDCARRRPGVFDYFRRGLEQDQTAQDNLTRVRLVSVG